jgi:Zn-dependent protease with chaperone function
VPSLFTSRAGWRNSGRAQKWSPLKPLNLKRLWLVELVSAIALLGVVYFFLRLALQTTNAILVKLPFLAPIQLFYRDPAPFAGISFVILLIVSPWLLDALLKHFHGLQALPLTQLTARSPEAAKVVQRLCRQRKLPVPILGILPTNAPVILTYGNLPRTSRIVVSEGLLAQLTDDEVATLYTGQLGHVAHWDMVLMSLGVLLVQIFYTIYWQVARWGEQLTNIVERKLPSYRRFLPAIILGITGVIASISYAIYWLLGLPLLWLSRARVYYSDRLAIETTGNPNGLTRALLKMALGMAEEIQHDHQTSGLLEGFDLLLPVGYRQALTLGSCSPQTALESVLHWDCINPYRGWLIVSASHPLLGERVAMLCRNAQFWKLDPELSLPALAKHPVRVIAPPVRANGARLSKLFNSPKAFPLLQSAVFFGLLLGLVLRGLLWVVGQIGDQLNIWQIIWMHNASPFLDACILIAFSLSLFLWINRYFPDIKPTTVQSEPNLGTLLSNPATLPPDSLPVQLTGQLLGRQGLLNGLGQDLILQTSTGLVKLHFSSFLGPLGNLLPQPNHPSHLVNQQITVTGWFRRGVTPWIDIETLRSQGGKVKRANYPLWLTILAFAAALWGAYLIWRA